MPEGRKTGQKSGFALCSGVEVGAIRPGDWAQVLKEGSYYVVSIGQVVDFSPALLSAFAQRFAANPSDIPTDYEHAIMKWIIDPKTNARPDSEGWWDALEYRPGDGLYARLASLSAEAAAKVSEKKLKYLSVGIIWNAPDLKTGERGPKIASVSLTLYPNIYDMTPIAASALESGVEMGGLEGTPPKETSMKNIIAILNEVFGLALAEDADEASVAEAVKRLAERVPAQLSAALGHADATRPMELSAALSAIEALRADRIPAALSAIIGTADVGAAVKAVATLQAKEPQTASLAAIQKEIAVMKAEKQAAYLDAAVATGKFTPAERPRFAALLSANETLGREIIDGLPSTGIMTVGLGPGGAPPAGLSAVTATDDEIAFIAMNAGGDAAKIKERMVKNG